MSPAQLHRRPGKEGYSAHANIWSIKKSSTKTLIFVNQAEYPARPLCVSPCAAPPPTCRRRSCTAGPTRGITATHPHIVQCRRSLKLLLFRLMQDTHLHVTSAAAPAAQQGRLQRHGGGCVGCRRAAHRHAAGCVPRLGRSCGGII